MTPVHDSWPPLIVAADKPAWIRLRDSLISLAMWTILALLLATSFNLLGSFLELPGIEDFTVVRWIAFLWRLLPFIAIAGVLLVFLALFGLLTILRRRRGLVSEAPRLLDLADEARRGGIGEGELLEARALRIAIVDKLGIHGALPQKDIVAETVDESATIRSDGARR